MQALREGAARWERPRSVNADHGSQFSSAEFGEQDRPLRVKSVLMIQQNSVDTPEGQR